MSRLRSNGGDLPDPRRVVGGLLGADYKIENGRYRLASVFNGENWNPQLRAPLTHPGGQCGFWEVFAGSQRAGIQQREAISSLKPRRTGRW